jgi:hypothetical protein
VSPVRILNAFSFKKQEQTKTEVVTGVISNTDSFVLWSKFCFFVYIWRFWFLETLVATKFFNN